MALLVGVLLAVFVLQGELRYAAVVCGAAIEVGEAALWWHWTHRRRPAVGAEALIGLEADVVEECRPLGRVRLRGELWSARCASGADVGDRVRVLALDALTLEVEPLAPEGG